MQRIAVTLLICIAFSATPCLAASSTQQAIAEYNRENYEEALDMLAEARQSEGKSPLNDYYTGLSQKQTGDYSGAVNSLRSSLEGQRPYQPDAAIELIALLINLDQLEEAQTWVDWATKEQVKPKEIAYLKGLLLIKQKRYSDAVISLQAAKTGNAETDQQIEMQIAVALAQDGKTKEASDSLKAIVTRYPGTDAAAFASEYDQRISTAAIVKRWNLYAGVSYLYDDNVTLKSKVASAVADPRNQHDGGITENLRLEYDLPIADKWSTNFQYALQNNNYLRLHDYDMLVNGLTVNFINRNDFGLLALPLNITHTALDYRNYSLQMSFKPTATAIFSSTQLGQLSIGYSYRDMLQKDYSADENRTASIFNMQTGYIYLFADGRGMFNLRGEGFYENTDGKEWRNWGGRLGSDLLIPVAKGTKLILTAEGAWQDYSVSSTNRHDTTVTASASINQQLTTNLYLNLQYYYTRALSNVDLYDYQRNVIMSGVELRF